VNYDFPMQSEDYVHRIGRTGRALAVGDAISFVTPEDAGDLRALERFIGRGIVRKRAEGFNYTAAPGPSFNEGEGRQRQGRQQQGRAQGRPQAAGQPQREGQSAPRPGGARGGRRFGGGGNRWRR
jgi:ATP-dependent RNA helicase RhlE